MNTMIYLRYRRRGESYCEECGAVLKWVYDGISWIPCDAEPVLIYPGKGDFTAVYKRELIKDALFYKPGMQFEERPEYGLSPHIFNCRKELR